MATAEQQHDYSILGRPVKRQLPSKTMVLTGQQDNQNETLLRQVLLLSTHAVERQFQAEQR